MNSFNGKTGVLVASAVLLLSGCAGDQLHKEGLSLMESDRYEEGLAKLHEAAKSAPDNAEFLKDEKRNREQVIAKLTTEANVARSAGKKEVERKLYERILGIDRANSNALAGLELLAMDQRHEKRLNDVRNLIKARDLESASALLKTVQMENPASMEARQLARHIQELSVPEVVQENELTAKYRKPVTLQFKDAPVTTVFEALSRISGINIMFDKDVRKDLKVTLFVKDVSVEDSIDMIMMQGQLEKKVVNDNLLLIYPNTPTKLKEYQELVVRSFHLTNADPKAIQNMLKTLLKSSSIFVNEKTNSIIIRDTPDAVQLAEKLISDQDIAEPEVMMEVEVLEVTRNRLTDLGVLWPSQMSLTAIGTAAIPGAAAGAAANGLTLNQLRHINGNTIVTSPNVSLALHALMTDSDTNIIASPRIRARNREKAKIMIGERVPIITQGATPVTGGTATVVTANVRYIDVGLSLDVEPDIHLDNEVAIKVNMEVSSITNTIVDAVSGTRAYQIGTRNASTLLQLKDGETQILGGLIDNEMRNTANKVPGLGQLPGIGRLFSQNAGNGIKTEIILSITPHIVGKARHAEAKDVQYWSGTESSLRSNRLQMRPGATVDFSQLGSTGSTGAQVPVASGSDLLNKSDLPSSTLSMSQALVKSSPDMDSPVQKQAPVAVVPLTLSWSAPAQVNVGEMLVVQLDGAVAAAQQDVAFRVNYDTALFKLVSVNAGNSVAADQFSHTDNEAAGQVQIGLAATGPTGSRGRIATLTLQALHSADSAQLTVDTMQSGAAVKIAAPEALNVAIPEKMLATNAP